MRRVFLLLAIGSLSIGCKSWDWYLDPLYEPFGSGRDGLKSFTSNSVVNACAPLVSATNTTAVVAAPFGATPDQAILVWQLQDSFATLSDDGPVDEAGRAGRWELARVTHIAGSELGLFPSLELGYLTVGTAARAQVCTVPEYADVTVAPGVSLEASSWSGESGGIVAFFADSLVLGSGAAISADAAGFRGGEASANSGAIDVFLESTSAGDGAGRGESLDATSFGQYGRGNLANGGGGGNALNSGGGGGGGAGPGGLGGHQVSTNGNPGLTNGRGGTGISWTGLSRISPGGGGGGGQQNEGMASAGARGGGVVLIVLAKDLSGAGTIRARGGDALDGRDDGAGGGGAGGTIVVAVGGAASGVAVRADGGRGGGVLGGGALQGPGGGGGGGRVCVDQPLPSVELQGGMPGTNSENGGSPHGAVSGQPGFLDTGCAGAAADLRDGKPELQSGSAAPVRK